MENNKISLEQFLESFNIDEQITILEEDNIIFKGIIKEIPFKILNNSYVQANSVYLDNNFIIIEIFNSYNFCKREV